MDHIGGFFHDGKTDRSVNLSVFCEKVCDIHVIQNVYIFTLIYGICEEWLEVLAIDLNVTVSSCHVIPIFILENHKTKLFHICRYFIKFFCGSQKEVVSDNSCRIFGCVIYIILRLAAFYNIGIDCVDTCCEASASFDVCFFCDQNGSVRISADGKRGIAACGAAAYNQDICMYVFYL